jgi:hypothetical protein
MPLLVWQRASASAQLVVDDRRYGWGASSSAVVSNSSGKLARSSQRRQRECNKPCTSHTLPMTAWESLRVHWVGQGPSFCGLALWDQGPGTCRQANLEHSKLRAKRPRTDDNLAISRYLAQGFGLVCRVRPVLVGDNGTPQPMRHVCIHTWHSGGLGRRGPRSLQQRQQPQALMRARRRR